MTYRDFIEEHSLKFGLSWEKRRTYIKELIFLDIIKSGIIFINPFTDLDRQI